MKMGWRRPLHIPFPCVWIRFKGKIEINGKLLNYIVQDVSNDLIVPVVDFMTRYFLVREDMMSSDGVIEDEVALMEVRELWLRMLRERMSVVALVEGDAEPAKRIVGCNLLAVTQKSDQIEKFQSDKINKVVWTIADFYEKANIFEAYDTDIYLNALGLCAAPQYQGDNIGYYLLMARTPLCQATGLHLTVTIFSNPAAIYHAIKSGFDIVLDTTYGTFIFKDRIAYPRLRNVRAVLGIKRIPSN